jgi:hypothetical protein
MKGFKRFGFIVSEEMFLFYNRFKSYQSFYSPTDAQVNCLKNDFKICIKIYSKTTPTCFGAVTIIRERIIRAC